MSNEKKKIEKSSSTKKETRKPKIGYTKPDHPIQRDLIGLIGELGNIDLSVTARGLDGC